MFFSTAIRVKCGIPERDTRQHSFLKLQKSNLSFGFAIMNLSEADRLSQIQFSIGESDRGRSLYPLSSGSNDRRKDDRTDRSCRRQSQRRPDPHSGDRRQLLYGYGVCSPGVPQGDAPSSSAGSLRLQSEAAKRKKLTVPKTNHAASDCLFCTGDHPFAENMEHLLEREMLVRADES